MFSLRAIISTFLYLVLIPTVSAFLSRKQAFTAAARDLTLSHWSVHLLIIGSFIMVFSSATWVFVTGFAITVLGSGASITLRSFLASSVEKAFAGRLFAAISMVGTLGGLVGMPIMGALYTWGITHECKIATPFAVSAVSQNPSGKSGHNTNGERRYLMSWSTVCLPSFNSHVEGCSALAELESGELDSVYWARILREESQGKQLKGRSHLLSVALKRKASKT